MSEINLLTTEVKLEQKVKVITNVLSIFLGISLLIVGGLGYYFNSLLQPLASEKKGIEDKISSLRNELTQYSNEEFVLRDIKSRYDVANKFYKEKIFHELMVREIYLRNVSGGVEIKTITIDSGKELVSVRVSSDSTAFKRFVDNLKASQPSEDSIKDIFSNSGVPEDVNEVSKEYVVTVKYNKGVLNAR